VLGRLVVGQDDETGVRGRRVDASRDLEGRDRQLLGDEDLAGDRVGVLELDAALDGPAEVGGVPVGRTAGDGSGDGDLLGSALGCSHFLPLSYRG
jgi:hypothetical protein